jgi:hypothetical protein
MSIIGDVQFIDAHAPTYRYEPDPNLVLPDFLRPREAAVMPRPADVLYDPAEGKLKPVENCPACGLKLIGWGAFALWMLAVVVITGLFFA